VNDNAIAGLLSCCLFLWTIVAMAVDAQEKRVDPSGTWRWDLDMNGETIKNVLKLEADKEGKLSGTLEASDRKLNVEKGQVDKDEVTFSITLELNQTIEVQFRGKQKGDSIQGKFTAKTPDDDREFKWEATRSVEIADVLGTWQLSIGNSRWSDAQTGLDARKAEHWLEGEAMRMRANSSKPRD
jgi:hypothetical protein